MHSDISKLPDHPDEEIEFAATCYDGLQYKGDLVITWIYIFLLGKTQI